MRVLGEQALALMAGAAVFLLLVGWLAPAAWRAGTATDTGAILIAVALGAGAMLGTSLFFAGRRSAAQRRITRALRGIAAGNYGERVPPEALSALADGDQLGAALNDLALTLQAAEQRRVDLLGDVAHELRTPVAILLGYLEGLLDGYVKPAAPTWAMLHDETTRLHRLVDELQALARAEAHQQAAELESLDPAAVALGALDRLRLHFAEKGLDVVTEIPPGLPPVRANRDHILQVLNNLLTNSLRYTPAPGRVTLRVSAAPGGNEVIFQVSDTGVGISPEHIPHLFERFFRVDRSRNRAGGGSGIGLPLAKALVEAMGGRIWAESAGLGGGSTFYFAIPIAPK